MVNSSPVHTKELVHSTKKLPRPAEYLLVRKAVFWYLIARKTCFNHTRALWKQHTNMSIITHYIISTSFREVANYISTARSSPFH